MRTWDVPFPGALRRFFATEAASGVVLLGATIVALAWANSPWGDGYRDLWSTAVAVGPHDLRHWVDDALMAVFFFVVGVEVKRELVLGELRDPRAAALPLLAALGGMAMPALLFLAVNAGHPGSHGWGVPMATDIAFATGVVALLGRRVPSGLRLFLLTLAVADDIGAIVVIAVAYAGSIDVVALGLAALALLAIVGLRRLGVTSLVPYVALAGATWVATFESGVHATIAGVALGLLVPAAAAERFEQRLHPLSAFVVLPVFALANAGLELRWGMLDGPGAARVAVGVALGLVVGKAVGITVASWLAIRLRLGLLPSGATWRHIVGIAALGGIGFTVALFVSGLAFDQAVLADAAVVGIIAGSLAAAAVGAALLLRRPA